MKTVNYLICAGLIVAPGLRAQANEKPTTDKEEPAHTFVILKDSLTGCLHRGDESNPFYIEDPENSRLITVIGSSDLVLHVDQMVKVQGEYRDNGRIFHAKQVDALGNDCSSAATAKTTDVKTTETANETHAADNTAVNREVGRQADVTADDQHMDRTDQEITRRIRRAVVDEKDLSVYAHNVKIIAQDGKVTLKGPVRSEEERNRIADMAAGVVGVSNVNNEMTIAPQH